MADVRATRSIGCWPGCRRPIRSAPSATATASRRRSRRASSRIARRWSPGWTACCGAARAPSTARCSRPAWRAAGADDWPAFDAIAERAAAWRGTSEMALESRQQGGSFLSITRTAWPHAAARRRCTERLDGELALPVAVALAAAVHGIALEPRAGGLSARLHRQPDLGRAARRAARPDRWPDCLGRARKLRRAPGDRGRARGRPPWTRSARRRRCSTGARSATRPSTRGCSAHDRAAGPPAVRSASAPSPSSMRSGAWAAIGPRPARRRWRAASWAMAAAACRRPRQCLPRRLAGLWLMALWPWYVMGRIDETWVQAGTYAIAGVFMARGVAGYSADAGGLHFRDRAVCHAQPDNTIRHTACCWASAIIALLAGETGA